MKPRAKTLMLILSLALLAGAWLLAEYMDGAFSAGEAAEAMSDAAKIDLSVGSQRELTTLSWSYGGETVNLARDERTNKWVNADDDACPIDNTKAGRLARAAATAKADMAIDQVTDMAAYGLTEPVLTVVAATDQAVTRYEIGSRSLTGQYYLRRDGGDTVYLENGELAAAFETDLEALLALESVPEDIVTVTGLSVRTEAGDYTLSRDAAGLWLRRGEEEEPRELGEEAGESMYRPVTELALSRCVSWNAKPERYGLASPQGEVTLAYIDAAGREKSFTLEFGSYTEEDVYVRFAGSDMVYAVPGGTLDRLMYPDWESLLPSAVLPIDKQSVAGIHLAFDGREYDIDRLRETSETTVAGQTVEVTDVIYSCNGWVLDTAAMDGWLDALAAMTAENLASDARERELLLSVTLTWNDETGQPATLEIRSYDSAHYLCVVDGERRLLVSRPAAQALITEAEEILAME